MPAQVAGRVHVSDGKPERDIAIAVNGRIEAVGRTFHLLGETAESYAVMVPEASSAGGPKPHRGARGHGQLARAARRLLRGAG